MLSSYDRAIVCDPQTSGGLLVTVSKAALEDFYKLIASINLNISPIGKIIKQEPESKTLILK